MNIEVKIPYLKGTWTAPASKSELIRLIALAMQCEEQSVLKNTTLCNDVLSMLNIAEAWGAEIGLNESSLMIKGCKKPATKIYHAGESALCLRLLIPILSKHTGKFTIEAEGSLLQRPIGEIETIINQSGAKIESNQHFPPVKIGGKMQAGNITVENPITSQNISGLLMSLPLLKGDSRIKLNKLISLPYIQMTIDCLKQAGVDIEVNHNYTEFLVKGQQKIKPLNSTIEGDWSAASLIFAASAIYGDVQIKNLNPNSSQADKKILDFIKNNFKNHFTCSTQEIKGFEADITHCPDLFPALIVIGMHAKEKSVIGGINRLLYKESNRIDSFIEEFSKFGVKFNIQGDKLNIIPPENISSAIIDSHNDHRIAMAAAVAIAGTKEKITITNAGCVNKSYPSFWEDLKCLGAEIHERI